jgi:hypothetical protein
MREYARSTTQFRLLVPRRNYLRRDRRRYLLERQSRLRVSIIHDAEFYIGDRRTGLGLDSTLARDLALEDQSAKAVALAL